MIKLIIPVLALLSFCHLAMAQEEESDSFVPETQLNFESELRALEDEQMLRVEKISQDEMSEGEDQVNLKSSAIRRGPAIVESFEQTSLPTKKARRVRSR